jgi:hypothetical protein
VEVLNGNDGIVEQITQVEVVHGSERDVTAVFVDCHKQKGTFMRWVLQWAQEGVAALLKEESLD